MKAVTRSWARPRVATRSRAAKLSGEDVDITGAGWKCKKVLQVFYTEKYFETYSYG